MLPKFILDPSIIRYTTCKWVSVCVYLGQIMLCTTYLSQRYGKTQKDSPIFYNALNINCLCNSVVLDFS